MIIYVANSNVWCVGFQHFSVLSSEVVHVYAYKTLMCLLMVEAIGPAKCRAQSRVPGFQARFSLFQSPQVSLVSLLISVCTVFFPSVFLYLLVWMCWVPLLPWCHVVPAPGFSRYPFSWDVKLLVWLFLMHVQLTSCCQQGNWLPFSQLIKAYFFFLPRNLSFVFCP